MTEDEGRFIVPASAHAAIVDFLGQEEYYLELHYRIEFGEEVIDKIMVEFDGVKRVYYDRNE